MTDDQHNIPSGQPTPDDVLRGLDALAETIDSRVYPGRAWSGPVYRRGPRRFVIAAVAAAAAAAIVLLAAVIQFLPTKPKPTAVAVVTSQPTSSDSERPKQLSKWSVPLPGRVVIVPAKCRVDVALAGKFTLKIPDIQIPPDGEAGRFAWNVPKFSFSTSLKRKKNNDLQEDTRCDAGASAAGRVDLTLACRQPRSTSPRQGPQRGTWSPRQRRV